MIDKSNWLKRGKVLKMKRATKERILETVKTILITLTLIPIVEKIQNQEVNVFLFIFLGILIALVSYIMLTVIFNKLFLK